MPQRLNRDRTHSAALAHWPVRHTHGFGQDANNKAQARETLVLKERVELTGEIDRLEKGSNRQAEVVAYDDLDSSLTTYHLSLYFEKNPGLQAVRVADKEGAVIGRLTREEAFKLLPPQAFRSTHRGVDHLSGGLTWPQVPRFRCQVCGFEDDFPLHNRRKPKPNCPIIQRHGPMSRLES